MGIPIACLRWIAVGRGRPGESGRAENVVIKNNTRYGYCTVSCICISLSVSVYATTNILHKVAVRRNASFQDSFFPVSSLAGRTRPSSLHFADSGERRGGSSSERKHQSKRKTVASFNDDDGNGKKAISEEENL